MGSVFLAGTLGTLLLFLRPLLVRPFQFGPFLLVFSAAAAVYLLAMDRVVRDRIQLSPLFLALTAFVFRSFFVTSEPLLSTDVFRYIWDGNMVLHGVNPLSFSPVEAARLHPFLPGLLPPDHRDIPSVYPPLSLLYFATVTAIHAAPWLFGFAAVLLDTASVVLLSRALLRMGKNPSLAVVLAWHPLSILESGHSGHVEALGILFLCLALWVRCRSRTRGSLTLAACGLVKLWPVSLLCADVHGQRDPRTVPWAALLFLIPATCLWLGAGNFSGILQYGSRWEFHAAVYSLLKPGLGSHGARIVCGVLFLAGLFWISVQSWRGHLSFEKAGLWICGLFLLLSPTVHPWYALWLLPFLALSPHPAWLYLTLAVATSYAVLPGYFENGVWRESVWPRLVTYGPFAVWLVPAFLSTRAGPQNRTRTRTARGAEEC